MKRRWLGSLCGVLALVTAPGVALAAPTGTSRPAGTIRVSVSPGSGGPHTAIRLRFRVPASTGMFGTLLRRDSVQVTGPRAPECIGHAVVGTRGAPAGTEMSTTLAPARLGGRWCVGTYGGRIVETVQVVCRPAPVQACPQLVVAPRTLATFSFRIRGS